METTPYVHGYQTRESERLRDQAQTLTDLLHGDTAYAPGSKISQCDDSLLSTLVKTESHIRRRARMLR